MYKINVYLFFIILLISNFTASSQANDWKQYSSSMAGLKINYPSDWRLEESNVGRAWQLGFLSPGVFDYDISVHSHVNICIQPVGNIPNPSNTQSGCRQRDDHLSDSSKDIIISEETFQLNGLQIRKKVTRDRYEQSDTYIYAFFTAEGKEFWVSSYFTKRFGLDKYLPVFDQMLGTIQVLKQRKTLTYRNDKYDFALNYLTSWKSCPVSKPNKSEEEILLLVPEGKLCNGGNYISVLRIPGYSGELMTGFQLQDLLKKNEYTKINPFLNGNAAQGEKIIQNFLQSESYFFTNYLFTYDLLKIFSKIELKEKIYQKETKEILSTTQRHLKTTQ
jgi:hypothetical protein